MLNTPRRAVRAVPSDKGFDVTLQTVEATSPAGGPGAGQPVPSYYELTVGDIDVVVISDGDAIENRVDPEKGMYFPLGFDRYAGTKVYGNREFFVNAMNYLLNDKSLISLRSRTITLRQTTAQLIIDRGSYWDVTTEADLGELRAAQRVETQNTMLLEATAKLEENIGMAEVMVAADSELVGHTVIETQFRTRFGLRTRAAGENPVAAASVARSSRTASGFTSALPPPRRSIAMKRSCAIACTIRRPAARVCSTTTSVPAIWRRPSIAAAHVCRRWPPKSCPLTRPTWTRPSVCTTAWPSFSSTSAPITTSPSGTSPRPARLMATRR